MSHRVLRQSRFLLSAIILILTLFSIVACTTEKPPPTSSPPLKITQSAKIARPVETPEATVTLPSVALDTPTDIAAPASLIPTLPNAGLPTSTRQSSKAGLPKGTGLSPTRLVIRRMNLDAGIREATQITVQQSGQLYTDWFIPYDAVGHLVATANPGESGNMVISGHHNLIGPNQFGIGLFGGLWDLQVGDAIYVFDESGRAFAYSVSKSYYVKEGGELLSVREQHAGEIMADTGEPILTLTTCWNGAGAPYSGNTYRWIIAARLVDQIQPGQVPVIVRNPTPMQ